jgi:2-(1,2-epoxy-1,2-dihydrophenyl)acetyl-CoA isomerase
MKRGDDLMEYNNIIVKRINGVGILSMNQPHIRNAFITEIKIELLNALEELEKEPEIKCIIITGEGKAFSAGGDLNALKEITPINGRKRLIKGYNLLLKVLEIEKPVIAAVNGPAAGSGCSFALACDLIIASDQAVFVQSFVNVGLIPDFGAIHFLPILVGPQRAKEIMFSGEKISAEKALQIGLINEVTSSEKLMEIAISTAEKIAAKSPISVAFTKRLMNQHIHSQLRLLLELEATTQDICLQTSDFKEGVASFFEKRSPVFQGR